MIATTLIAGVLLAQQPTFHCYLGVLHAHSVLSPDFEPKVSGNVLRPLIEAGGDPAFEMTNGPMQAWRRAADAARLDFLALTDHLHGEQNDPCAHEMPSNGYRFLKDSADRINNDPIYKGKFLAIPGMEWNTIGGGNHVNIFFAKSQVPNAIRNTQFDRLLKDYLTNPLAEGSNPLLLVQMNHPNANPVGQSYGRGGYPAGAAGDRAFAKDFGAVYSGIEHINNHDNGNANSLEVNAHRDGDDLEPFYKRFLNMGFRLGPVGDHDNHRANWGRHTAARTGIWAKRLTPTAFVEAFRARRFFATEDNELVLRFKAETTWMGSDLPLASSRRVKFTVRIDQKKDSDTGQFQNEGPYEIELVVDVDGPGGALASRKQFEFNGQTVSLARIAQGTTAAIEATMNPASYAYVHVRETADKDAGANADAWSAPVFFPSAH